MDRFRKILAVVFGLLSLFFAVVAIRQYVANIKSEIAVKDAVKTADWGQELKAAARQGDRLIFFKTPQSEKIRDDGKVQKVLDRSYIYTEIDPHAWPADYIVLDKMLAKASGNNSRLMIGVLTPKMRPIFLASYVKLQKTKDSPNLEAILQSIANEYKARSAQISESAGRAAKDIGKPKEIARASIGVPSMSRANFSIMESANLLLFFNDPKNVDALAAILSENARLAMRIAAADMTQAAARKAAVSATEMLYNRIKSGKDDHLGHKMLIMRALAESTALGKSKTVVDTVAEFSDELISMQGDDGLFYEGGNAPLVREAALGVEILLRAHEMTADEKYLKAAEKTADTLAKILAQYMEMPAQVGTGKKSQASALDYALTAKAFAAMHAATKNRKYLDLAEETFSEMNEFYMTDSGIWSINSVNSPLADYAQTIFFDDTRYPAYTGEAAQTLKYLKKADPAYKPEWAGHVEKIILAAIIFSPRNALNLSSIKLSRF